jgi:hypothetical protein
MRRVLLLACLLFTLLKGHSLIGVHYTSDPSSFALHFKKAQLSSKYQVKEDVEDEKSYSQLIKNTRFLSRNTIGSPLSIHLQHLCGNIEDRLSLSGHSPDIYLVQRVLRI